MPPASNHDSQVPQWADLLTSQEYEHFFKCLNRYFASKKLHIEIQEGLVQITNDTDNLFGGGVFGLYNLMQSCKANRRSKYQQLINSHFDTVISAREAQAAFEKLAENYDDVRHYLAIRLYDNDFFQTLEMDKTSSRILADTLREVLVFDLPTVIQTVSTELIAKWNTPADSLYETAIQNMLANYDFELESHEINGDTLIAVSENHFFVAAILYNITTYPELIGTYGSLLAFPTRDLVLAHPINSKSSVFFSIRLAQIAGDFYENNPGSLSKRVFMYRDGKLTDVHPSLISIDSEDARMLSPELTNLFEEIPEET
ncbi:MAG: hypothetical protein FWD45_02305 [Coriobacteriia bacterium]|nr:hypothetical protein [Coriobacteriia bacterium]